MQIVIEMSEHEYEVALRDGWVHGFYSEKIKNGKPLPKGHGRLIDADRMKRWVENCECCSNCKVQKINCNQDCKYPDFLDDVWGRAINEQLTIIEADKEEQSNDE